MAKRPETDPVVATGEGRCLRSTCQGLWVGPSGTPMTGQGSRTRTDPDHLRTVMLTT